MQKSILVRLYLSTKPDDEVVAKAAAEDVWTRGKRALLALGQREPPEASKEQPDDEGFLARVRGAGKRLVG